MSVLKGEGTHAILYGTYTLPSTRMVSAYFARPDRTGTYRTVVVAHDSGGITPHTKAVARHLGRHGFAVICPDLFRGRDPSDGFASVSDRRAVSDLAAVFEFTGRPGTEWAGAESTGLLGLGSGGRFALLAAGQPGVGGVAVIDAPLGGEDRPGPDISGLTAPVLGIFGADGDHAAAARDAGAALSRGEVVLYQGAGAGFMDDSSDTYDAAVASDALDRLVAFFGERPPD